MWLRPTGASPADQARERRPGPRGSPRYAGGRTRRRRRPLRSSPRPRGAVCESSSSATAACPCRPTFAGTYRAADSALERRTMMRTRSLSLKPGTALGLIASSSRSAAPHSPLASESRALRSTTALHERSRSRRCVREQARTRAWRTFPIGSPAPATSSHASSTAPARPFRCAVSRQESSRCGSSGSRAPAP